MIAFSAFRNLKSTSYKIHDLHVMHQNNIKFSFLMTRVTKCWNLHVDTFNNNKYKFCVKLQHVSSLMERLRPHQLEKCSYVHQNGYKTSFWNRVIAIFKTLLIKHGNTYMCLKLEKNFFDLNGSHHRWFLDTLCGRFDHIDHILTCSKSCWKPTWKGSSHIKNTQTRLANCELPSQSHLVDLKVLCVNLRAILTVIIAAVA